MKPPSRACEHALPSSGQPARSCLALSGCIGGVGTPGLQGSRLWTGFAPISIQARSRGRAADGLKGTGGEPRAVRVSPSLYPAAARRLAGAPHALVAAILRRVTADAHPETVAAARAPIVQLRGRQNERCLGGGRPIGPSIRRETVPHSDDRGLLYERSSRDRCEDQLPSPLGHRRTGSAGADQGQAP